MSELNKRFNSITFIIDYVKNKLEFCDEHNVQSKQELLQEILSFIKDSETYYKSEIELAKLLGRNELLKEQVNKKQLN